jgi:hypothetical protein
MGSFYGQTMLPIALKPLAAKALNRFSIWLRSASFDQSVEAGFRRPIEIPEAPRVHGRQVEFALAVDAASPR